jgi:hypothetical protein
VPALWHFVSVRELLGGAELGELGFTPPGETRSGLLDNSVLGNSVLPGGGSCLTAVIGAVTGKVME